METITKQAKPVNSQCPKLCDVNIRKGIYALKKKNRKHLMCLWGRKHPNYSLENNLKSFHAAAHPAWEG